MAAGLLERIFRRKELRKLRRMRERFLSGDEVPLTQAEKNLIFNALCFPAFKEAIHAPKTSHLVRGIYKELKIKMAASIRDMGKKKDG